MGAEPFYFVRRYIGDIWCVCHRLPGGTIAADLECPSHQVAEYEATWMNAQRQRDEQAAAQERKLCGVRA